MDPANRSSTSPPFRLLALPLELQRTIFGYALFTQSTLRRPSEVIRYGNVDIFSGTNMLRVSGHIYKETLPIFYQVNNFHYEHIVEVDQHGHINGVQDFPPIFIRSLHMIRHISIDPIQKQPYSGWWDWNGLPGFGDRNLDKILVLIERAAPNLRTLALHFPPFDTKSAHLLSLLRSVETGGRDGCSIPTLCRLRARLSRLSFVYYEDFLTDLSGFRSNIAPLEDWTMQTLDSWPVVMDGSREYSRYSGLRFETRAWNLCRHPGLHAEDQES